MANVPGANSESATARSQTPPARIFKGLGLGDTISIIVGIVIGVAIFRNTAMVFSNAGGPVAALGLWLFGGFLSLCGALCYAELATNFPRNGGDYEYLTRAYGAWVGFLFGWAQLTVILSGSIGSMAYTFADYAAGFSGPWAEYRSWVAAAAVAVLTVLNLAGLVAGRWTQNLLASVKVAGLAAIIVAAMLAEQREVGNAAQDSSATTDFGLAMVFVMLAYGGWNDAAFVAAEVRHRNRKLPQALFAGLGIVTVVYLGINIAYLTVLGYDGACRSQTPAADVLHAVGGDWADRLSRLFVMISALGAINGMILTGSRVYAVVGQDNRSLAWMGRWNRRSGTPVVALICQAAIVVLMILIVGTEAGRAVVDRCLGALTIPAIPWEAYFGGFETLVAGTAPTFWFFFLLTGITVFILRRQPPAVAGGFRVPGYPLVPLLFCASCGFMLVKSFLFAKWLTLLGIVPLLFGIPFGFTHKRAAEQQRDNLGSES